ncbi:MULTISPECIES: TonB-dependent receptor [unclassified Pseudomonas]|uniref:TonB-dependent receptor n=1 Tax=unclassified Pseudomonas TaxID=196821 RepID=UPI002448062F|nr:MULTISPECIES: TonB-dependent receptor [unclassified Pseudomonas]MDG9925057.1 TonB-dependent receptor [Pseudomonas sp. GD04045]MDH0037068.1 TonB-dependent receptor [Pseudomonas sp. GD04019]
MPTPFPLRTRLASSILLACSSLLTAAPAAWAAETTAEQSEQLSFDIPAQSLDDALSAYGIASGAQVLYDAGLTQGLSSQAVSGQMDRQQALQQLLAGTGLSYRFTGARTVTLEAASSSAGEALEFAPILITGEKIERDLQQTTSSVAVVGAEQIERARIQNLPDAFRMMANVRDADWADSGYIIRGINSEGVGGPAGRPLATVYVDGVAQTMQGARRGALGMWDVEQVEVLRGPQSTTSGRNALAGAIRIESKDPTYHWESAARGTAGSLDTHGYAAMVSGPLVEDKLAFRLAAERSHADGGIDYPYFEGMPRLDERQDDDYWQVRGKLLFQPHGEDGVRVLLSHSKSYDSPAYNDVDGPSGGVDYFDREWGNQSMALFTEARSTINYNTGLEIAQPLSEGLTLTSLTTHVKTETSRPSVDLGTTGEFDEKEIAQELRLNWDNTQYSAVAGVYLNTGEEKGRRDQQRPWESYQRRDRSKNEVDNYALFGEMNWHLTEQWTLISGMRYDYEKQDYKAANSRVDNATGAPVSSLNSDGDTHYDAWLPKVGVQYQIDKQQNLGFVVQRAYRGGGTATNYVTSEIYDYDAEYAWNYELSYRSLWADGKLRLNANLFHLDWDDQQVNVPQIPGDFTSDVVINAGKSHVDGFEIELGYQPLEGLDTFASLGMAKTEFDEFYFVQNGVPLDLAGEAFPQAPEWTAALGADYQHHSGWFVGGDLKYTGSTTSRSLLEGAEKDGLPVYTLLNLRTGYAGDQWRLTLWANNVTDEEYYLYRYDEPGSQFASVGRERVIGTTLDLTY